MENKFTKPEVFINNILAIYGNNGRKWLNQLPNTVANFAKQWGLSELTPLSNLSHNYVLSGFKNDLPIILKLGLDYNALTREAAVLEYFINYGAVKVLAKDVGSLLLQKASPGTSVKELENNKLSKISTCCEVSSRLHKNKLKPNYPFPTIHDWLKTLDKNWQLPNQYLKLARNLRDKLLSLEEPQILLHGDLHYDNILKHNDEWLIIDPKGVMGYPIYEVCAYIVDIEVDTKFISEFFNYDLNIVKSWHYVYLILAVCWRLEDNLPPDIFFNLAKKSYSLL